MVDACRRGRGGMPEPGLRGRAMTREDGDGRGGRRDDDGKRDRDGESQPVALTALTAARPRAPDFWNVGCDGGTPWIEFRRF